MLDSCLLGGRCGHRVLTFFACGVEIQALGEVIHGVVGCSFEEGDW